MHSPVGPELRQQAGAATPKPSKPLQLCDMHATVTRALAFRGLVTKQSQKQIKNTILHMIEFESVRFDGVSGGDDEVVAIPAHDTALKRSSGGLHTPTREPRVRTQHSLEHHHVCHTTAGWWIACTALEGGCGCLFIGGRGKADLLTAWSPCRP